MTTADEWLDQQVAQLHEHPERIRTVFPAVSRRMGREPLQPGDADGLHHGGVDDAARGALMQALPLRGEQLVAEVAALYRFGDAGEKRGVLRSLHLLDGPLGHQGIGDGSLELVRDGLRSNDTRMVAAACAQYGAERLDTAGWRQAVLKCVFTGVPLTAMRRLDERADDELARMLVDFARERVAAGRAVPDDVWLALRHHRELVEASDLPEDVTHPVRQQTRQQTRQQPQEH